MACTGGMLEFFNPEVRSKEKSISFHMETNGFFLAVGV